MLKLKCKQSLVIGKFTYILEGEIYGVQAKDKDEVMLLCLHGINRGLEVDLSLEDISEHFIVMDEESPFKK